MDRGRSGTLRLISTPTARSAWATAVLVVLIARESHERVVRTRSVKMSLPVAVLLYVEVPVRIELGAPF